MRGVRRPRWLRNPPSFFHFKDDSLFQNADFWQQGHSEHRTPTFRKAPRFERNHQVDAKTTQRHKRKSQKTVISPTPTLAKSDPAYTKSHESSFFLIYISYVSSCLKRARRGRSHEQGENELQLGRCPAERTRFSIDARRNIPGHRTHCQAPGELRFFSP